MTRQPQRNYFDGGLGRRPAMFHHRGWGVAKTPPLKRGLNFYKIASISNLDHKLVLRVYMYHLEHILQLVYIFELFHEQSIRV